MRALVVVIGALVWGVTSAAPALAVVFPVTSTADSGGDSLRDAIDSANAIPGLDTIDFAIGTGPQTISPTSALPEITDPLTVDGTSQPGFSGTPIVRVDGAGAGAATGLIVSAGSSTVRGLELTGWGNRGIELAGGSSNVVAGNYLGTDGSNPLGNANAGVIVDAASVNNTIGGTVAADRNVLSGNGRGVVVSGSGTTGNIVEGNYIGTDAGGNFAIGNSTDGILVVNGADGNTVGGIVPGAGNVSSGNGQAGVDVTAAGSNVIEGNYFGTNAAGNASIGNLKGVGLGGGSPSNVVGGTTPEARNVISGNRNRGVVIGASGSNANLVEGNSVGLRRRRPRASQRARRRSSLQQLDREHDRRHGAGSGQHDRLQRGRRQERQWAGGRRRRPGRRRLVDPQRDPLQLDLLEQRQGRHHPHQRRQCR